MKKKKRNPAFTALLVIVMAISLLSGCGEKKEEKEEKDTITVYLWSTSLYEKYASYIQEQLPDINIEFVVGSNNLDFYKFLNENGGLPDIITCCRFSLHDASPLKDSLMDLSTTNEAGAVYNSYLTSFMNEDGSVNWLPVCADVHGFIANKDLFEKYDIPLPTDYESFVSACQRSRKREFGDLVQITIMITPAWKHCRDCRQQSFLQQPDASGVQPTAIREIQRRQDWTRLSGRRPLNVWSSSFRIRN